MKTVYTLLIIIFILLASIIPLDFLLPDDRAMRTIVFTPIVHGIYCVKIEINTCNQIIVVVTYKYLV
jgi:hypothetical protein